MKCKNCGEEIIRTKVIVPYELGDIEKITYIHRDGYAICNTTNFPVFRYAEPKGD